MVEVGEAIGLLRILKESAQTASECTQRDAGDTSFTFNPRGDPLPFNEISS